MDSAHQASAGTLESNDILVTISASAAEENTVSLESMVIKQFGPAILAAIHESLSEHGVRGVHVQAKDKGALDCTIKARMEAAIMRYKECPS